MAEAKWDAAYNEFYQAFRNYQEAGNVRARDCLKYVVLASMLVSCARKLNYVVNITFGSLTGFN